MMHLHTKILFLLIMGVCLLTSTIQAQTPDLIGVGNIASGDMKCGVFEIDGVILDPEVVSKVAVKVGNGPWANAEGIGTWKYKVDSRQIVTGSSYTYDSATGKLVEHYQLGPYYGALNITIGAFDTNGNQVATKTLNVNIIPEPPYSDILSGSYGSPLNVILKTAPGLSIYYTLDGTDPTVNGSVYFSPIYVAQSTVINAVAKNNNNQYSDVYTLNLTVTGGTAQPVFTIQYYYDEALTKPLPDSPYLKAGTYYLKIISNTKLTGNPQLSIQAPGTLNNINQVSALPLSDGVYYYPRVITDDTAATGDTQETITFSGNDIYGNQVQNAAPLNANIKAAFIDTQPPTSGSIGIEGYVLSTSNPMPYFLISSNRASQMRLALNEADLSTAAWVDYANHYGGFDISNGGNGPKTVWIEFRDWAGNIQPQHVYTTVNYDNSALGFDIGYYSDSGLTHSMGLNPYLSTGTYYLKIIANQDLDSNTVLTVSIDAEGINNDVSNETATRITNRIFYYVRTIINDPAAIGNTKESIKVMGTTPLNTDTMAAFTCMSVLTPEKPVVTSGTANQLTVSWTAVTRATAYEVWYGTSNDSGSATKFGNDVIATSCTINGLMNGTTYFVWLKAKNSGGVSNFSPSASGTVIPDIPTPMVTAGTNQLTVSWSAITGASAYEVWINTVNDNTSASKCGSDVMATTYTITGLTDGAIYYVWLKSKNNGGTSDFSSSANATIAPGQPGKPSVIAGTNQLTVSWSAVTGASAYEVWINTVNDNTSATKFGSDVTATTCTINGLTNGTTYFVWLKAKNSAGTSGFSSSASGTVAPSATGMPVIASGAANQLTVSWTAVIGATAYEVWYSTVNDISSATKLGIDIIGTTCNITGLTSSTTYYVWLKAKNAAGTSGFSPAGSQTVIPDIPVPVVTTETNQLTVTWTAVLGATAYEVWYGTSSNSGSATKFGNDITSTTCTITGLAGGTNYYVWVKAKNSGGTSNFSSPANGVPLYPGYIKGLVNFGGSDSYTVILVEQQKVTNYNSSTYFTFSNLAPGTYHVKLERSGYASVIKEVTVSGAGIDIGTLTFDTLLPKGTNSYVTSVSRSSGGTTNYTLGYPQTIVINYSLRSDYPPFDNATATVQVNGSTIWSGSNKSDSTNSGAVSVFSNYYGNASIKLSGNNYTYNNCSLTVQYSVDNEAPAIYLAKTWCYSSQDVQTSVNCTDSISGISSCYYALTNSLSTPSNWIQIPASTAIQITDNGTWYLHVKATDVAGNSYERIEGPYIITN